MVGVVDSRVQRIATQPAEGWATWADSAHLKETLLFAVGGEAGSTLEPTDVGGVSRGNSQVLGADKLADDAAPS